MDGVIVDAWSNTEMIEQMSRFCPSHRWVRDPQSGRIAICIGEPLATANELREIICRNEKRD